MMLHRALRSGFAAHSLSYGRAGVNPAGLIERLLRALRSGFAAHSLRAAGVVGVLTLAVTAGCSYELRGRVIESGFDSVELVPADDARVEDGPPVVGARVVLTRDPGALNRSDAATAVAATDGWFTLRVDDFGSGWMEEVWGVRVARRGYGGAEDVIELPFSPSKHVLLVTLSRGPSRATPEPPRGAELWDDADRYWQSPGGR